jgi:serine/threonine protein kinase
MKKSGGRFEERESLHYGSQALHAVSYLHERSVIHRDIKPENMLLDAAGNIKLTDFGWACHAPPPRANIRSTLCGTPEYISPEMVAGQPYGQEVDIWAIGVLLYELLSGVTPFGGKSPLTTELSDAMAADDQRLGVGTDDESHCIYDRIAAFKGKLSFPEGIGSSQSLHLVTQLLQPDPKQRPSASHVLRHEWIA